MRVIHVSSYFAPAFVYGGPPRSILGLCQGLVSAGVDVEVLTTTANGDCELPRHTERPARYEGVPVRYFPLRFPRRFFGVQGLERALVHELVSADLVHIHGIWNVPAWIAMRSCHKAGVPYVVSPRGMLEGGSIGHHRYRKMLGYHLLEKRGLRRAVFLHATSTAEHAAISALALAPPIVTLPNGVAPPEVGTNPDLRAQRGIPAGHPLVVYLGRLHPTKRLDLLVAAFAEARRERPELELVIAGRADGVEPSQISGEGIHLVGQISDEDKWALLEETDVLVMCSDSESFCLSVVEALARGVPVVVTKTCPWEAVERHRLGFWVEQSVPEIATAIVEVLNDDVEAGEMGARGRELVARDYQWSSIGTQMAGRYEHALSGRR